MSRATFIRRDLTEARLTDKVLYVRWSADVFRFGAPVGPITGTTVFRVARDLYDTDDVEEACGFVRKELLTSLPAGLVLGLTLLTWWTLLELTQADRDATPPENR